jgi:hypothetical protein
MSFPLFWLLFPEAKECENVQQEVKTGTSF